MYVYIYIYFYIYTFNKFLYEYFYFVLTKNIDKVSLCFFVMLSQLQIKKI